MYFPSFNYYNYFRKNVCSTNKNLSMGAAQIKLFE